MNIKLGMIAALLSVVPLTVFPIDLNAGQDQRPWQCQGKCRTWVVIDSENDHMAVGEKFQIRKFGTQESLIALSHLKGNWEETNSEFGLTRIGPSHYNENSRFCGFVDIKGARHGNVAKGHMYKIKLLDSGLLQIDWFDLDKSLLEQPLTAENRASKCTEMNVDHGGRVHAEPN